MGKEYRITILMAIYNCETTLAEAIDSLYAQTYQGFKLVLCDDSSTDQTYQIEKNQYKVLGGIVFLYFLFTYIMFLK